VHGRVRALVESAPPEAAAWAQRAMAARPDSIDTLRGVRVPALVVVGGEDELATVSDAEAMAGAMPDSRLVVVRGSGHLTAVEAPAAFDEAVSGLVSVS
ncbi:MAG: alpha/beta fold hydrolase, partial [Gaiellaceae bacterium]